MAPANSGDAPNNVPLTPRLSVQTSSSWRVARAGPVVLGDAETAVTAPLSLFAPAEPPIAISVQPAPGPAVLGEESAHGATLSYQPAENAVYVLLQEVHTPDGVIYDWTLPNRPARADSPQVLGEESAPGPLVFPLNPVAGAGVPDPSPQRGDNQSRPAVLGLEDVIGGALADVVMKRVLQVVKSPIDSALLATVRHFEPAPRVLAWRGAFQPLDGFEAWRALLPPGREQRVLLYVHGFNSSIEAGGGALLVPQFADRYDAILGYDHPTLGFAAGLASLAVAALAIHADSPALALAVSPGFGAAYGMVLVAGLRASERLAEPAERGATTAVYLALTYVGFVVPYLVSALSGALGDVGATAVTAGAVAACAALVVGGQARTSAEPAAPPVRG